MLWLKLQPDLLAKISTLEQHNLQAAAEIKSLKEVNVSLSFLSVMLILFAVQEVKKPVSTVVTALLDKNAKLEQQARKDQILAFFLSKMQFLLLLGYITQTVYLVDAPLGVLFDSPHRQHAVLVVLLFATLLQCHM